MTLATRDRLIQTMSSLLRSKGYGGFGVSEVLSLTSLPKGSLYHHFPGGKAELAREATLWASKAISRVIEKAFADAPTFHAGLANAAELIGDFVSASQSKAESPASSGPVSGGPVSGGPVSGCPVSGILQAESSTPDLRELAATIYGGWIDQLAGHAERLNEMDAHKTATLAFMTVQGAWHLAVAQQSREPLDFLAGTFRDQA